MSKQKELARSARSQDESMHRQSKDLLDFSQTAAALSNLDLVVCNDTSLAHLAGAMGIPCWIILPYEVNWRWHTDLSVCDWYESVRLFRQHKLNDWAGVIEDVKAEMLNCLNRAPSLS